MKRRNTLSHFTKKYSLSKTLRFELVPELETKKYLDQFVNFDIQRDKDYQEPKQIIDEYHKDYIEKSLSSENILKPEDLKQIYNLLCKSRKIQLHTKKEEIQKEIDKKQKQLRNLNFYYCRLNIHDISYDI